MLKSMTGYGRSSSNMCGCDFTVEIRSVNHRYLDCAVRVPRLFVFLEDAIKSCVTGRLSRGKVDVYLNMDSKASEHLTVLLNKPLVSAYLTAINELRESFQVEGEATVAMLSRMPDVFVIEKEKPDVEAVTQAVVKAVNAALDELEAMRTCEGKRLCESILSQTDCIEDLIVKVEKRSQAILPEYHSKLEARIRDMMVGVTVDESRLLTEVAIFADKIANNEETVRLRSHIAELKGFLKSSASQGRKVDFLVQEMNREANTIGSKGNDAELAHLVVDLKAEIEKIREQVQNLE